GLLAAGCSSTRKELPYPEEISVERGVKDKMLGSASDSPIAADKRQGFLPLAYFAVDEGYRVPAVLVPAPGGRALARPTSPGGAGARDADFRGGAAADASRGAAEIFGQGPADDAHGFRRGLGSADEPALRPLPGHDQRHGHLSGGALSGTRSHRDRSLRPRLQ